MPNQGVVQKMFEIAVENGQLQYLDLIAVMVDKMPDNEHEEFAKALFDNDKESESV
jgi:hypothetical protein